MIAVVTARARLLELNDELLTSPEDGPLVMRYSPADPFAVSFTFEQPDGTLVEWRFARDILADGVDRPETAPAGLGDVKIWRGGSVRFVYLRLGNRWEMAVFAVDRFACLKLLRRSYALVARGREHEQVDLDDALAKLLTERG